MFYKTRGNSIRQKINKTMKAYKNINNILKKHPEYKGKDFIIVKHTDVYNDDTYYMIDDKCYVIFNKEIKIKDILKARLTEENKKMAKAYKEYAEKNEHGDS